jgi:hypothetical protein
MKVYIVCRDYDCDPIILITTKKEYAEAFRDNIKSNDYTISIWEREVLE